MIKDNKVLKSLRLEKCDLSPKDLCDVCGMNTTLTSLDLSENAFDEQSIASLGTFHALLTKSQESNIYRILKMKGTINFIIIDL